MTCGQLLFGGCGNPDLSHDGPCTRPPIRVLRILEYVYPDAQAAAEDMARWTHAAPVGNQHMRMRSATLPFETLPMAEPQPLHEMYPENRQDPKPQPSPWKFGRHPGWGGHGIGCGTGRCCPGEPRG